MHMSDALVSPAVGGVMWCASAALIAVGSAKLRRVRDDLAVPMMGVLGAFVFVSQMINFSIPGTGASGHLGGGMLLAVLLGPWRALLTVASVLLVQAVFFADGGLLALGCNIFNMGVLPCLVAYPLVARPLMGCGDSPRRVAVAVAAAAVVSLQLGAFSVVLETWPSGISALPFDRFLWLMQPIHLAIGLVEGLATAAIVLALRRGEMPELAGSTARKQEMPASMSKKAVSQRLGLLALAALLTGGALSWFASVYPDGLEWAIEKTTATPEVTLRESATSLHRQCSAAQQSAALMPDYDFKRAEKAETAAGVESAETWPNVNVGTSVAGITGGALVVVLLAGMGLWLRPKGAVSPAAERE